MPTNLLEAWLLQSTSLSDSPLVAKKPLAFPHRLQVIKFLHFKQSPDSPVAFFEVSDGLHTIKAAFHSSSITRFEQEHHLLIQKCTGMLILLKAYSFDSFLNDPKFDPTLETNLINLISSRVALDSNDVYLILNIFDFFSFGGEGNAAINARNLTPLIKAPFFTNFFDSFSCEKHNSFVNLLHLINNTNIILTSSPKIEVFLDSPLHPESDDQAILNSSFIFSDAVIDKIVKNKSYYWSSKSKKTLAKRSLQRSFSFSNVKSPTCSNYSCLQKDITKVIPLSLLTKPIDTNTTSEKYINLKAGFTKSLDSIQNNSLTGKKNLNKDTTESKLASISQYNLNENKCLDMHSNPNKSLEFNSMPCDNNYKKGTSPTNTTSLLTIDSDAWFKEYANTSCLNLPQLESHKLLADSSVLNYDANSSYVLVNCENLVQNLKLKKTQTTLFSSFNGKSLKGSFSNPLAPCSKNKTRVKKKYK
ncbi:hypothetical protein BB561_004831 [Smittium simulii]|uniref:Uncharacterized protein n=1 Tax=Smittium simulii TaxID=133385 RepID=A0A2T9YDX6_9FUNG|nr:hypothetical protein BB561_004831 [Smittium simulii]